MRTVSASEAKARLSSLLDIVEHQHSPIVIERHGRPVAVLVSADDAGALAGPTDPARRPIGALALLGAWKDLGDDAIDELIVDIYRRRREDTGRPVSLEG